MALIQVILPWHFARAPEDLPSLPAPMLHLDARLFVAFVDFVPRCGDQEGG